MAGLQTSERFPGTSDRSRAVEHTALSSAPIGTVLHRNVSNAAGPTLASAIKRNGQTNRPLELSKPHALRRKRPE